VQLFVSKHNTLMISHVTRSRTGRDMYKVQDTNLPEAVSAAAGRRGLAGRTDSCADDDSEDLLSRSSPTSYISAEQTCTS